MEDGAEAVALDVVGEVGAEEVVHHGGVGRADAAGEAQEAVDLDRIGIIGIGIEEVGDPVVEAVAVAEEGEEVAEDGVGFGAWVSSS